ncbi:hypothetical protein [Dactylosporangium sp. NPDC048998]|uniref:hypothetical protein n=1 Tax=Dactylosporangium sp. NPDC048998 TaxID=3363976 RepID=UPI0037194F6D
MTRTMPAARRVLSTTLTALAGTACVACCTVPLLLAAGVLSGAGWAAAGQWMPGIAVSLVALAALAWWRTTRLRIHRIGCAGSANCSCAPQ